MGALGLHSRDLRVLDPALTQQHPSALLCRERVLLVSLEAIRCMVTPQGVLALNVDHPLALRFLDALQARLRQQVGEKISCLLCLTEHLTLLWRAPFLSHHP